MKSSVNLLIGFICVNQALAQSNSIDSISKCISELNSRSVIVAPTYVPKLILDESAQKLVTSKNSSIDRKLCKAIADRNKFLATHVILTMRHHISTPLAISGLYQKDTLIGFVYTYNKLEWRYYSCTEEVAIADSSIRNCEIYWRKKYVNDVNRELTFAHWHMSSTGHLALGNLK